MYENILIPTDASDSVERAVEEGLTLAEVSGASVHTLYVVETGAWTDYHTQEFRNALRARGEQATAALAERGRERGITVVTEVRSGVPYREILDYVDEHEIDCIVMGTHGLTGLDRYLLGSVAGKVVRLSEVPVLTVSARADEN